MAKKIIEIADPKLRIILSNQIRNALGYLGGQLSQSRKKSIEYYLGDKLGTEIDGRSQVVSTDVSDTVVLTVAQDTADDVAKALIAAINAGPHDSFGVITIADLANQSFFNSNITDVAITVQVAAAA